MSDAYDGVVEDAVAALNEAGLSVAGPRRVAFVEEERSLDGEAAAYMAATDRLNVYTEDADPETVEDAVRTGMLDKWYVDAIVGVPEDGYLDTVDGLEAAYDTYLDAAEAFYRAAFIDTSRDKEWLAERVEPGQLRKHGLIQTGDIVRAAIVDAEPGGFAALVEQIQDDIGEIDTSAKLLKAQHRFREGFGDMCRRYGEDVAPDLEPVWARDEASQQVSEQDQRMLREHWNAYSDGAIDAERLQGLLGRDLEHAPFEPYEAVDAVEAGPVGAHAPPAESGDAEPDTAEGPESLEPFSVPPEGVAAFAAFTQRRDAKHAVQRARRRQREEFEPLLDQWLAAFRERVQGLPGLDR